MPVFHAYILEHPLILKLNYVHDLFIILTTWPDG